MQAIKSSRGENLIISKCFKPTNVLLPKDDIDVENYLPDGTLQQAVTNGDVLVERTTASGIRLGSVGLIDLKDYDFDSKNPTFILMDDSV